MDKTSDQLLEKLEEVIGMEANSLSESAARELEMLRRQIEYGESA